MSHFYCRSPTSATIYSIFRRLILTGLGVIVLCSLLAGCAGLWRRAEGIGEIVPWSQLPGWSEDRHAEAWPALLQSCKKLRAQKRQWRDICLNAELIGETDNETARAFFETRFEAHTMLNTSGKNEGLITGYYEPLLNGSRIKAERFRYPVYQRPDDLLIIDLDQLYPELNGRPVRGRLEGGNRVVPYFSREEINNGGHTLAGHELVWVDDPIALFFLQIQGSGRIRLPDGEIVAIGYADQNGHPYNAIGRELVNRGAMALEEVSLQTIRAWLEANPDEAEAVLNSNPSYVFFAERDPSLPGPLGAMQVPLTPQRSIAVDPAYIPLGFPVWLDTTLPDSDNGNSKTYRRLVLAQDTGGAIKGAVRADVFYGKGEEAEAVSGRMKQPGQLYVLLPRKSLVAGQP